MELLDWLTELCNKSFELVLDAKQGSVEHRKLLKRYLYDSKQVTAERERLGILAIDPCPLISASNYTPAASCFTCNKCYLSIKGGAVNGRRKETTTRSH